MPEKIVLLSYEDITPLNVRSYKAAATRLGITLQEWLPHEVTLFCDNKRVSPLYKNREATPDAIIHRTVSRLQGVILPALKSWQAEGTVILNDPNAAAISRDKLATNLVLIKAGIPVVTSLGFMPWDGIALDQLGSGPLVVKPAHGLQGKGVTFYDKTSEALDVIRKIQWEDDEHFISEHYVAQPRLGNNPGQDIRAYVVNGYCLGIMRRVATSRGEYRANMSLGATAQKLDLDHPGAVLAVAATKAMGLDYAGVDMIEDDHGELRVLEVDAWAGFAGLESVTGADVSGAILQLALQKIRNGANG